ncbi:MAG: TrkH family potassium uptake protein [Paludibacteraceae bacterium]|nr:TrkH family potassium uptake protein [Paludibacteraceae bacterium]
MTHTFNWKMVFKTQGALLLIESAFLLLPTLVAYLYHESDAYAFSVSTVITALCGLLSLRVGRHASKRVGEREGYVIVALVWVIFSLFGMMPFYLSGAIPSFTDAFFETMSGFTTTGATILDDIEAMSHGVLFWRSLMQWLGGMGIIVLTVAILPMFGLGGMQLYSAEATGISYEKLSPRITDTAKRLWVAYTIITALEAGLLMLFGMGKFDAVCHSFSTIATGGFSTKNLSIAAYASPAIHYTIAAFTLLSGINFTLIIILFRGKPQRLFKDEEAHWYLAAVGFATAILTAGLYLQNFTTVGAGFQSDTARSVTGWMPTLMAIEESFRYAFFEVVCTITSCGFALGDYMTWKPVLWVLIFFLMFAGGCAGSTAGGIKWVRIMVFTKNAIAELRRRIHPNAIFTVTVSGKPLGRTGMQNVMAFLFFYIMFLFLGTIAFCALGVGYNEALGTAVAAIGNIGPALGDYGPAGTYAAFPTIGKWIYAFLMLVGRLELFTVLLLFSPTLWRK